MSIIPCPHCLGSGQLVVDDRPRGEIVAEVLNNVAAKYGMLVPQVISRNKRKQYVDARREAAEQLWDAGFGPSEIAFYLGKRDHSTIVHALNGHAQ